MGKIKFLAAAAMLAVCSSASAQFSNSKGGSQSSSVDGKGWSTIYVQYNPSTISIDETGVDDENFNAFTVGYNRAISISSSAPFYVDLGGALQYSFKSKDMLDWYADVYEPSKDKDELEKDVDPKEKYNMLSLKVPVSIMYDWKVNNSNVHITPFAGITMRYNIFGNKKKEYNFSSDYKKKLIAEYGKKDFEKVFSEKSLDLFDKKDMGSKDATWNRFQFGWQLGVNARFNDKFLIGASYGSDFSEIYKKAKISAWSIQLGYTF